MIEGIRYLVRIQTPPEFNPLTGQMDSAELWEFDSNQEGGPAEDIVSIVTHNDINEACGTFTIAFSPREVERGRTWLDVIPAYSLVEIWMQRYPLNPEPVLVMLGLTGTRRETANYTRPQPQQSLALMGRSVSCVLVDQQTFFLNTPPESVSIASAPALSDATLPDLFGPASQLLGTVILSPDLAFVGIGPIELIDRFVRVLLTGEFTESAARGGPTPLLNWALPASSLSDVLFFDASRASVFDPNAHLSAKQEFTDLGTSLWNYMSAWSDSTYQELFSETRDLRFRDPATAEKRLLTSAVEIVFRKKPFAGRIDESGSLVEAAQPTGSQFDPAFLADENNTVIIAGADLLTHAFVRAADQVKNLYHVFPVTPGINQAQAFGETHGPLLDDDPSSPSYVRRFGPRLMRTYDRYLELQEGHEEGLFEATDHIARERELLLRAWHRFEPLFRRGEISVKGNPMLRCGSRALTVNLQTGRAREFYVTGVTQTITCGDQVSFETSLSVERGWDVS